MVNPRSLRRWFLANPCYEYQRSPSDSDDSYTQRNVSTSEGKISVRLDVARTSGANLNQHNGSPPSDKTVVDKIKHTICGHLTRYFRSGVISSKVIQAVCDFSMLSSMMVNFNCSLQYRRNSNVLPELLHKTTSDNIGMFLKITTSYTEIK